ncbi:hypothetical protein [Thermomonas sp. HDW16]|uniref:hypothetical protein n=1 Tax=Thermomonas sp. HDW16 TaxID=2714945 RepID=UPI00140844BF|nr:hypothetical protein [Thermomonas sp. HDW16]QIL20093.1 hypothetical protein G7079_04720 [Thermomonas sp. HDW16]
MRQVFTSPRLENVEAVAALLREADIEVKITEGRSYRGNRRGNFSYRAGEESGPQPAVWIVRADDQPRGRQLLREAGLLDSSRIGESSYLPLSVLDHDKDTQASSKAGRAMRIKLGLLVAILAVIGLMVFGLRKHEPALPAPTRATAPPQNPVPTITPQSVEDVPVYRAKVPTALAKLLVERELAERTPAQACIAIDGKDPPAAFMQGLQHAAKTALSPASACPGDGALDIDVHEYMTDGSGRGTVQLARDADAAQAVEVERNGEAWRVLRMR